MSQSKKYSTKRKTLSDSDIVTQKSVGRRNALSTIGGVVAGTAALVTSRRSYGQTDSDTTTYADPAGRGQFNDSDGGRFADPGGGGTDSDVSQTADPAGRGYTGVTDSDGGSNADRVNHGRSRTSGITDSDGGQFADPAGNGRGRRGSDPIGRGRFNDSDSGKFADPAGGGTDSD